MPDLTRGGVSRISLLLRGIAGLTALAAVSVITLVNSAGGFTSEPEITAVLPAASGPIQDNVPVQYRGVAIGRVVDVRPGPTSATLTLRIKEGQLDRVPAGVQARLLPRTLFGDQYLDLAVPQGAATAGTLRPGAALSPDTSAQTVQLYVAYTKLYDLITALEPAKIQVALGAVADLLRGRGAEYGQMIDDAAALVNGSRPLVDSLGDDITAVAGITRQLAASAPDLLATLDNAVALSRTVVDKQHNLAALLVGGGQVADQAQRMLTDNSGRFIQLVRATGPVTKVIGAQPELLGKMLDSTNGFLEAANRGFSTGRLKIRVAITLDQPYPYTPADCPRYPGLAGPNCGQAVPAASSGTTGPVGSPQEQQTLQQLLPYLPTDTPPIGALPEQSAQPDLFSLLLGPLVRGSQVVIP